MTELGIVYMAADCEGELLYVGSTNNLKRRVSEHARLSGWWPMKTWVGAAVVSDLELAREFERVLISGYQPVENVRLRTWSPVPVPLFQSLPTRAAGADLSAVKELQQSYLRHASERLNAYGRSMAAFVSLRANETETVGECSERLRKQGQVST